MNISSENRFYDVTMKDLFALSFKHWRKVLAVGIVFAVALGLFKFIPMYKAANSKGPDSVSTEAYTKEKTLLEQSVKRLQNQVSETEKELKESIYYSLDSSIITCAFSSFYVNTSIKDEDLGYQKNLVYAYVSFFDSGEIYNNIANQLSEYIDPVYLKQIVTTEVDYTNNLGFFDVSVMGNDKAQVSEIMGLIKKEIYKRQKQVAGLIGNHTISLVSENVTAITDDQVKVDKDLEVSNLKTLNTNLSQKRSQLEALKSQSVTSLNAVIEGMKYFCMGLLGGMGLTLIYFAALIIFSNRIKSRKQIANNYNLYVLGEFSSKRKKGNKLDAFFSEMAGELHDIPAEEMGCIIANSIAAMAGTKKVLIVGCKDVKNIEEVNDTISSCEVLKEYEIGFCKELMFHSKSLAQLADAGSVVVVAKKNKTSLDELSSSVNTVEKFNKDFVGIILI